MGLKAEMSATHTSASSGRKRRTAAGLQEQIENYIGKHDLDHHAAVKLREADPEVQRLVIDNARPTKVRKIRRRRIDNVEANLSRSCSRDSQIRTTKRRSPETGDDHCTHTDYLRDRQNRPTKRCSLDTGEVQSATVNDRKVAQLHDEIEAFIQQNKIDAHAGNDLRHATPEVQRLVLEEGTLRNEQDPSSNLIRRILAAKANVLFSSMDNLEGDRKSSVDGGAACISIETPSNAKDKERKAAKFHEEIEDFIEHNNIDSQAGELLRQANPEVQRSVLEDVSIRFARNPSTCLKNRILDANMKEDRVSIKAAKALRKRERMAAGLQQEIQALIEDNDLDDYAANKLWDTDPEVLRSVIDDASLKDEDNPSAALTRRIWIAESDLAQRSRLDLQLLKDRSTRKAAQLRKEVEDFLEQNYIREHVGDEFLVAAPEVIVPLTNCGRLTQKCSAR
eukprot:gnl/MRDRNA2_/MRDRNA2_79071_c0_seq1.p1 gnl/MRDRNA2_/MRDRNA2_79071_c0~~gnl/MRDRNA2_/MRDRNA2_79071_c0_seq1.p1  ORF type:complete len:451 (+),score=86.74 gnl/MRDRNA2_/MRDRNA2_79071_c0_seq1:89-1441(+)